MIDAIGYKRTLVLGVLGGMLLLLLALNYSIILPGSEQSQRDIDSVRAEASALQSDIDKMNNDYDAFKKEQELYEKISKMGFFNDQDRILARERFRTIQKLSGVLSARYEVRSASVLDVESPTESGSLDVPYSVLESPIVLTLTAIDDLDIYRFIFYLNYGFPGHITIENLHITRSGDVTSGVLRQIGTGKPPTLLEATMNLSWRTMTRNESLQPAFSSPTDSSLSSQPLQ